MAAWFDKASSQGLDNLSFPLSTFLQSWGAWVCPLAIGGTQCVLSTSFASSGNYCTLYVDNAGTWTLEKTTGGTVATAGVATAGEWHYALVRMISATSVRISIMNGRTQIITHGNNTSTGTMTGFTAFSVGDFRLNGNAPTNFFGGGVGELFITNNDCYSGAGQQADNSFVKQLAFQGPLSIPRVRDFLVDYRSFKSSPEGGHGDEMLDGFRGNQIWTNTNGVMSGPHPPLPPGYMKVRPQRSLLVV